MVRLGRKIWDPTKFLRPGRKFGLATKLGRKLLDPNKFLWPGRKFGLLTTKKRDGLEENYETPENFCGLAENLG
jgi:hypothetical protein